jgi:hypothetical protein
MLIVLFLFASLSQAAQAVKKKTAVKKAAEKITAPAKKVIVPAPVVEAPVPSADEKVDDLKEDLNKALAELKGQVDKVRSDNSDAKVGATIFYRWQKYLANGGTHVNNFDIDRAYLDFKKKVADGASARVTLDVKRTADTKNQNLFDYLKYAYVELPFNVSALQVLPWSLTGKVGLQHTVWIDWADKIMDIRYIAKSLVDNEGVMSSSDFGVGALGKVSIAGLPDIDYHATVINGSGYAASEGDAKKDLGLRLDSTVADLGEMGKIVVGALANIKGASPSAITGTTKQAGLLAAWKTENSVLYGEYIKGTKISGLSLGGKYQLLSGIWAFYRMDNYDPDTTKASDDKKKSFYGATYDWSKDVKLAADVQTAQTGTGKTTSIFYFHTLVSI